MIILRTNSQKEYPIEWIGIADFDGCLRFEVADAADRMPDYVLPSVKELHELLRV